MPSLDPLLAEHTVASSAEAIHKELFSGDGLAFFSARNRSELLALAKDVGTIYMHRDADDDGVCAITASLDQVAEGNLGFTKSELSLHTDSSAAADPPSVILLWCQETSGDGGESHFLSAADLVAILSEQDPDILSALESQAAAVYYSGSDVYRGPVLTRSGSAARLRLRLDTLGYFSTPVASYIPVLTKVLDSAKRAIKLQPGVGYAVRNDTWLHGRAAYTGPGRTMLRILLSDLRG
jgi:hypothetical protein